MAVGVLGWTALALHLRVGLASGRTLAGALVAYFSYFTILTNLLAALALALPLLAPTSGPGRFLGRPIVATGVTTSMALVGITYSLLLRHPWNVQGLQRLVDIALDDAMPLLYLGWWWIGVPTGGVPWSAAVRWAGYPVT